MREGWRGTRRNGQQGFRPESFMFRQTSDDLDLFKLRSFSASGSKAICNWVRTTGPEDAAAADDDDGDDNDAGDR